MCREALKESKEHDPCARPIGAVLISIGRQKPGGGVWGQGSLAVFFEVATAIEERPLLNDQRSRPDISCNTRGMAEYDFLTGVDIALNRSVYFRDANIYRRLSNLRTRTNDKRAVLRFDLPTEIPIDAQCRFERHFARELQDISDEAEPIVFGYICPLDTFITSRNCLSTQRFLLSVLFL